MNPLPRLIPIACAAILFFPVGSLPARTWTQSATGKTLEADLVKVSGDKVLLRLSNGRSAEVAIGSLSAEDQAFILAQGNASEPGGGSSASEWPRWRGMNQDGISPDQGLLKEWPKDGPKKSWTYEKAGMGYSSFTVAGGKLFTMGTRGNDLVVIALDATTGEELWAETVAQDEQKGYSTGWGHGPRSTPTFDGGKIYALGPQGSLTCLDAKNGSKVWSKDLVKDFGGKAGGWGFSESPLVDGKRVIVAPGGNTAPLVALDKDTGETIWKASIPGAGAAEYATVVAADFGGTRQYVKLFQTSVVGVNAETGELVWTSPWPRGRTAVIPTPIVSGNQVYVTSGYGAGSKLIEVDGSSAKDVWDNTEMKNHHGGVVKVGDHLYGFSDGAGLVCQSWKTGEIVWNERGQFTQKGALHVADGMLVCVNESDGTVTLATATPEGFKQAGQFQLQPQSPNRNPQGKIWSHPLVLRGKLYLRDQEFISCFDVKG